MDDLTDTEIDAALHRGRITLLLEPLALFAVTAMAWTGSLSN